MRGLPSLTWVNKKLPTRLKIDDWDTKNQHEQTEKKEQSYLGPYYLKHMLQ